MMSTCCDLAKDDRSCDDQQLSTLEQDCTDSDDLRAWNEGGCHECGKIRRRSGWRNEAIDEPRSNEVEEELMKA